MHDLQTAEGFYTVFKADIAIIRKFRANHMIERNKIHKNTIPPRSFDSRNEVRISSHKNNILRNMIVTNPCKVKSDFYINAFLMQLWLKVFVSQWRFIVGILPQFPSTKLKGTFTNGKKIKFFDICQQFYSVCILRRFLKKKGSVSNRGRCLGCTRFAIIKVGTVQGIFRKVKFLKQILSKQAYILCCYIFFETCMKFLAQKCTINKNRCFHTSTPGKKIDLLRVHRQRPMFYIKPYVRSLLSEFNTEKNISQV